MNMCCTIIMNWIYSTLKKFSNDLAHLLLLLFINRVKWYSNYTLSFIIMFVQTLYIKYFSCVYYANGLIKCFGIKFLFNKIQPLVLFFAKNISYYLLIIMALYRLRCVKKKFNGLNFIYILVNEKKLRSKFTLRKMIINDWANILTFSKV